MRVSKSEYEIEKIKEAQKITEDSLEYVIKNVLREGVTEKELALEIEFYMRKNGAERIAFDLIVAAGANSSMPHAVPSDYRQGDSDKPYEGGADRPYRRRYSHRKRTRHGDCPYEGFGCKEPCGDSSYRRSQQPR